MTKIVSLNLEMVKKQSNSFLDNSNELNQIVTDLNDALLFIKDSWSGGDYNNFEINCNKMINNINNEIKYLNDWSTFISKSVEKYNENINNSLVEIRNNNTFLEDDGEN